MLETKNSHRLLLTMVEVGHRVLPTLAARKESILGSHPSQVKFFERHFGRDITGRFQPVTSVFKLTTQTRG